ncbi:Uncharacterised protein [Pragia fontium]|uniref:SH3 domain-containing protein n=1 Tax=Pragia fontium TaxID=82985 RepID=A0ABQ5LLW9_9GAMM|nr:hypothetical protein [Pragia fontium]GKX63897.1 hypothetical protein SOASR032_24660 [Pragia fontium]SUB83314.1 Uncharacterised protein [Pragia fontium]
MKIIMPNYILDFTFCFFVISNFTFACNVNNDDSLHSALYDGNGYVTFHKKMLDGINKEDDNYEILLKYIDCNAANESNIGVLSYYNSAGKVNSAFIINQTEDGNRKLYIIHTTKLQWHDGEPYGYESEFYEVSVFKRLDDTYLFDDKESRYFGRGADLFNIKPISQDVIYNYPYKSKDNILTSLKTSFYQKYMSSVNFSAKINKKTFLYKEPEVSTKTKSYLIMADVVKVIDVNSGWVHLNYHNVNKGIVIDGWVEQKDINQN